MSQKAFAGYLGVSPKTVEAWEAGTNQPSGAASRLLSMMRFMVSGDLNVNPYLSMSNWYSEWYSRFF